MGTPICAFRRDNDDGLLVCSRGLAAKGWLPFAAAGYVSDRLEYLKFPVLDPNARKSAAPAVER
jgi:hypothetical protein